MTTLTDLALAHTRRDAELYALDAAAGDGAELVALLDAFWGEARYAGLDDAARARAVLARVRGADRVDHGARAAVERWACAHGLESAPEVVGLGDPLAYGGVPVQGELFGETRVALPPWPFEEGPFDVVVADVPARELDAAAREKVRGDYAVAAGTFPADVPFVERLLGLVADDGVLALRLRLAVLRREYGRALVEEVGRRTRLIELRHEGEHVVLVLARRTTGDGGALLRALGSEAAARVLRAMTAGSATTLGEHVQAHGGALGSTSSPGYDEVWEVPAGRGDRVPTRALVRGSDVAQWRIGEGARVAWPYTDEGTPRAVPDPRLVEWLSPYRRLLETRRVFGRPIGARDVRWFEYQQHHASRWSALPAVVIARSGVTPRVAVLRSSAVVSGTALAIGARDLDDALFIAGVLGSSLAAFWMTQAFHIYPTDAGLAFELTVAGLSTFPMPAGGHRDVVDAMRRIDQLGRSRRGVRAAIDGDPERLDARLDGVARANAEIDEALALAEGALDDAVFTAFSIAADDVTRAVVAEHVPARRPPARSELSEEREELGAWLVDLVARGLGEQRVPCRPAAGVDVIADWVRAQPLGRAVLARLDTELATVLMEAAAPCEPEVTYSPTGLEKLARWAQGDCVPFAPQDYGGSAIEPLSWSSSRLRRALWRLRGRYNVPRERFTYFAALSAARGVAHFGSREGALETTPRDAGTAMPAQVDLDRMIQARATLTAAWETEAAISDRLYDDGWSARDVRVTLEALERAGRAVRRGGRWRGC